MDIEDIEITKKCFNIKETVLASLKLSYNECNSTFTFWNKYQIMIYENHNFEDAAKIVVPEFHVNRLINSNNYLTCLDEEGNIHVNSLKFKNSAQKRFKGSFQPKDQNVFALSKYNEDTMFTLKMEAEKTILCHHENGSEFKLMKKIILKLNVSWPVIQRNDVIFLSKPIFSEDFETFKDLFKTKDATTREYALVIISFDKISVYGAMCSLEKVDEEIELVKLYTSPSEICDIILSQTNEILIGLTIGTIVKLPLGNDSNITAVAHLNTALSRFLFINSNDSVIYTDGITLWKSIKTFSKKEIELYQFFLKNPYDFVKVGDFLICTTYTEMIYNFSIEDNCAYLFLESTEEYCSAENLLNNSEYFYKIHKELQKSCELNEKMKREESYITAIALSKRQDIMNQVIHEKVTVYENYIDCINENSDISLTEETQNYFIKDQYFLFIKIAAINIHHSINEILCNIFRDLKIHVTLSTKQKPLKTLSVKLIEIFKKVNLLVPLSYSDFKENFKVNVDIKIVTNIPGSMDESKTIWTVLHQKNIELNSEHFITVNKSYSKQNSLKDFQMNVNELVLVTATNLHGNLFQFSNNLLPKTQFEVYLNLPNESQYKKAFTDGNYYMNNFSAKRAEFIQSNITSEDFLKSKSEILFEVCDHIVRIQIENHFECPRIKIVSSNEFLANNIWNFFNGLLPACEIDETILVNDA